MDLSCRPNQGKPSKVVLMDSTGIIIILLLSIVFILPYLYIHLSAFLSVGKSVPNFEHLLPDNLDVGADKAIYFYFMSPSCSMCKSMAPKIVELKSSRPNLITIDINQNTALAKSFHVHGTPTLMAIEGNVIKKVKLGGLSTKLIKKFIAD